MSNWHKMSDANAEKLADIYLVERWDQAKLFVRSLGFGQERISHVLRQRGIKNNTPRGRKPGFHASPNIPRGEKSGNAKLTAAKVVRIRADIRNDYQIAKTYGVSSKTIANIRNGITWKHVPWTP